MAHEFSEVYLGGKTKMGGEVLGGQGRGRVSEKR